MVGTEVPTLSDKIAIVSRSIVGKSRKLKATWSIERRENLQKTYSRFPAPTRLIKKLRDRYGPK